MKQHPDRFDDLKLKEAATATFRCIMEAYTFLPDDEKRPFDDLHQI